MGKQERTFKPDGVHRGEFWTKFFNPVAIKFIWVGEALRDAIGTPQKKKYYT